MTDPHPGPQPGAPPATRPHTHTPPHPLLRLFLDAADGRFPPVDGGVTVLGPLPGGLECSVAFTGHAVIATSLPAAEVHRMNPDGFGASLAPDLLRGLAGPKGRIGVVDVTLAARGTGGAGGADATGVAPRLSERTDLEGHPRVAYGRSATNAAWSHWPTASADAAS